MNRAIEGLQVVAVGLVFLGNTMGVIPWTAWLSIFSLWPLLLIALGIELIGKALDASWVRVIASLVVLGGIVYGALFMTPGSLAFGLGFRWMSGPAEPYAYSVAADPRIDEGEVSVSSAVGDLNVESGTELVEVAGSAIGEPPEFDADKRRGSVRVELDSSPANNIGSVPDDVGMDLELSREVVWDVTLDAGAARIDADMGDVPLSALSIETGVAGAEITLGSRMLEGIVPVDVDGGVGIVTIRVPESVEARVTADTGIVLTSLDDAFERLSNGERAWATDGFSDASDGFDIRVGLGVGRVVIELYEEER